MGEGGLELKTVVKFINVICGFLLIGMTVFAFVALGFIQVWNYIMYIYWSMFGMIIIAAEFEIDFVLKYFRFLQGKCGKGIFLIIVGTWLIGGFSNSDLILSIAGIVLVCSGFITMLFLSIAG